MPILRVLVAGNPSLRICRQPTQPGQDGQTPKWRASHQDRRDAPAARAAPDRLHASRWTCGKEHWTMRGTHGGMQWAASAAPPQHQPVRSPTTKPPVFLLPPSCVELAHHEAMREPRLQEEHDSTRLRSDIEGCLMPAPDNCMWARPPRDRGRTPSCADRNTKTHTHTPTPHSHRHNSAADRHPPPSPRSAVPIWASQLGPTPVQICPNSGRLRPALADLGMAQVGRLGPNAGRH